MLEGRIQVTAQDVERDISRGDAGNEDPRYFHAAIFIPHSRCYEAILYPSSSSKKAVQVTGEESTFSLSDLIGEQLPLSLLIFQY